ncbi:MAG: hypothetical protein ACLTQI_00485 [Slackia sp.]
MPLWGLMGLSLMTAVVFLPFALRYGLTKAMRVVPVVMVMLIPVSIALLKRFQRRRAGSHRRLA